MKKGDTVTVYEDPITQNKPEGRAILVNQIKVERWSDAQLERWDVRFEGEQETHETQETHEREILVKVVDKSKPLV
jgi:hypothetical protein